MLTRISELPLRLIGPDLMRELVQERKKGETHQRRCRAIDHLKRERESTCRDVSIIDRLLYWMLNLLTSNLILSTLPVVLYLILDKKKFDY